MKRSVRILLILVGALVLSLLVLVANINRSHSTVKGIEVVIRHGNTPALVTQQTVRDSILSALPGVMQNSVGSVDRKAVALAAEQVPYLKDVSASTSVSGRIVIRATQRRPIARLFYGGREYLYDDEGTVMPAPLFDSLNLLIAGADYTEPLRVDSLSSNLTDLWKVASFFDGQKKYGDLIDQIYIEADGDLMMVPKLGNHVVELGTIDHLDTKFESLLAFYRRGMPRAGWDTYKRISLKYDGQVVCTKR